jgi:uncharacterized protein YdhG (YjbR/CyaY superfamily)
MAAPAPASVDEYLAALPEGSRVVMEQIRSTIRAAAPDATEVISYQIPTFKVGRRGLVSYAAFTSHFSLFPASGMVREALGDALAPYLSGKGTIRFPAGAPIPIELVTRVVEIRLAEVAPAGAVG